ncbi:hypothetical protein EPA93_44235 [Ktedonosporobacter rubrisoli]|uniref:ClpX-type ZB domain-containing protein n=1 Tax=Ktedonosporobacter rubrisoli TaxID=2509675 RepID=A0A4P6K502_KTERU|nr:hypothetical protein EPA93_44235 [Ktedonosporobacter rubrisoli]
MEKQEQVRNSNLKCSFCGKSANQVNRLTAGPGNVYICDECTDLFREHFEKIVEGSASIEKIIHTCTICGTRAPASHRYCFNCGTHF